MLVASTGIGAPAVKKRKKTSSPSSSRVSKKKKRKSIGKTAVPELILCADQLKSETPKKEEQKYEPIYEPVLNLKIEPVNFEELDSKSDNIKVKKKKKKRKSEINVEKQSMEEENSKLHTNISNIVDTEPVIKPEPATPEKPSVKYEPAEFTSLFNSNIKQVNCAFYQLSILCVKSV